MRHRSLFLLFASLLAAGCDDAPTMLPDPVASVEVATPVSRLTVGESAQLTATTRAPSGVALTDRPIGWSSSDTLVATVSASGLVRARGAGAVIIRAASEGRSGQVALTVDPVTVPVASILMMPQADLTLRVGGEVRFTAVARDASGATLEGRAIVWSSGTPSVASVDSAGLLIAASPGTAVISASSEGRSSSVTVHVVAGYDYQLLFDVGYGSDPRIYRIDLDIPEAAPVRVTGEWSGWDVTASPDGMRIAYTCTNGHGTGICVADRYGANVRVLTTTTIRADQPAWSPDGTRIAYRRWAPGGSPGPFNPSHIWVVNADGTGHTNLTGNSPEGSWQETPTWSPAPVGGAHRIAFSDQRLSGGYRVGGIASIRADGSDMRAVTAGGEYLETEPSWSPDGTTLVFVRTGGTAAGDLWLAAAGGGNERQLMQVDPADDQESPAWSPDGRYIAFASKHEPTQDNRWSYQIYTVRADGSELTRRTHTGDDRSRPAWILRH
jgi:hypothetical protein